ncbi:hypothetical protein [Anaerovorax odorimutans]|nr:hypothetical protein [Anaerovorax odorimutans]
MFLYLARVYEQILDISKAYQRALYRIPTPRLYLLYNGKEDFPREKRYRLSDAFRAAQGETPVELEVLAININIEKEHPILDRCPPLKEYSQFIGRIHAKQRDGKNRDIAVKEAIRECMKENILRKFLQRHGKEVYNMMFDEITYEDIIRIQVEEARELARKEAWEEAWEQARKETWGEAREQDIAGFISAFCEEGFSEQKVVKKLRKHFQLNAAEAQKYYDTYAAH